MELIGCPVCNVVLDGQDAQTALSTHMLLVHGAKNVVFIEAENPQQCDPLRRDRGGAPVRASWRVHLP